MLLCVGMSHCFFFFEVAASFLRVFDDSWWVFSEAKVNRGGTARADSGQYRGGRQYKRVGYWYRCRVVLAGEIHYTVPVLRGVHTAPLTAGHTQSKPSNENGRDIDGPSERFAGFIRHPRAEDPVVLA